MDRKWKLFKSAIDIHGMIKKAVLPVAGLGTRMLTATKEQPKEMLPIFSRSRGKLVLKPLIQLIFEQLFEFGIREFCFIVGRGKRAIQDHFTPDYDFEDWLRKHGKHELAAELENFYDKLRQCSICWIVQPQPRGFGDAVLYAKSFVGSDRFLVQAGDTFILSPQNQHLSLLVDCARRLNPDAIFLVQRVNDPRSYGVMVPAETKNGVHRPKFCVEKPAHPPSNLAMLPVYIFNSKIFDALSQISPGVGGEYQLTDGIQKLIEWNCSVYAVELDPSWMRMDLGNPELYWEALKLFYEQL